MVILVSPDSRGRIDLSPVVEDRQYRVDVAEGGVITLTPSAIDQHLAVKAVLSPEEAFGFTGMEDAAEAVYVNRESRRRGIPSQRVSTDAELHALIWGDAA
jgi:hypothetical protein